MPPLLPSSTRRLSIRVKSNDRATSTAPLREPANTFKRPFHADEDEIPSHRTKKNHEDEDDDDDELMNDAPDGSVFSADRFQHDSEDEEEQPDDGYVNEDGEEVELLHSDEEEEEEDLSVALARTYRPPTPGPLLDLDYQSKNSGLFEIVPPPLANPRSYYKPFDKKKNLESDVLKDFKVDT